MQFSHHAPVYLQTAKILGCPCSDYSSLFEINIQGKHDNHCLASSVNLQQKDLDPLH